MADWKEGAHSPCGEMYVADCPKMHDKAKAKPPCKINWDDGDELDEIYCESRRLQCFWCSKCGRYVSCDVPYHGYGY